MAFSLRCPAPGSPGSVTGCAISGLDAVSSFMGYGLVGWLLFGPPAHPAPSPRAAVLPAGAPGPPPLSLWSLGVTRVVQ